MFELKAVSVYDIFIQKRETSSPLKNKLSEGEFLMKKRLLMTSLFALATVAATACGGGDQPTKDKETALTPLAEAGAKMTTEELLAEAKKETGNFYAYGNTSRISAAMTNFIAKYGTELGLSESNAAGTKKKDSEIFTLLQSEYDSKDNSKGASMVLIQDSATLELYRQSSEMLTNYCSDTFKSKLDEDELVPLTHQYINKLFMWNNTGDAAPKFTNVWELLDAKYKDKIYFKSPNAEQVNMNFLITLTNENWTKKMTDSYKAFYKKDYVATKECPTASYAWIKGFLANADTTSYTSDTKLGAGLSKPENAGKVGLFVLSKLRDDSVNSKNLTVGAWEAESITPFAGFMYSIYAQLVTKAPRPYTAMLFTNYLMTAEGFTPWGGSIGGYSANSDIKQFEGDKPLSYYKQHLVIEDGAHINTVKAEMDDWINGLLVK